DDYPVPQYIRTNRFDVMRGDVAPAVKESMCPSCQGQINRCAWRSPVPDQPVHAEVVILGATSRPHYIDDVIFHALVNKYAVYDITRPDDFFRRGDILNR